MVIVMEMLWSDLLNSSCMPRPSEYKKMDDSIYQKELSKGLSIYLSIYQSKSLYIYQSVYPSIYRIDQSIYLSIYLSIKEVYLSIYQYI